MSKPRAPGASDKHAPSASGKRAPRPLNAARLERSALFYLERFSASAESLRRVLRRRVARALPDDQTDDEHGTAERGAAMIEVIIEKLRQTGMLDDARYAEGRAQALLRRGVQPGRARRYLAAKGVESEIVEAAIAGLEAEQGVDEEQLERDAARAFARRRRLGPFRPEEARAEKRAKDIAAMARAGFGFGVAVVVIDAGPDEV